VGAIKHEVASFEIDHPGKDTFRFASAGADNIFISDRKSFAFRGRLKERVTLERVISDFFSDCDIVFIEGSAKSSFPKIVLAAHGRNFRKVRGDIIATMTVAKGVSRGKFGCGRPQRELFRLLLSRLSKSDEK